jgi:hypothetical protein
MRRVLLLMAAVSLAGCFNNTTGPDAAVNQPFQLKIGEIAALPDGARLRFDNVRSDSRCPIDAICITAGNAVIAVTLMRGSGNDAHDVHTTAPQSQFSYAHYVIKLTELQPYPRSNQQTKPEDYVATFVVQTQ